jgi:hypothetical protein
MNGRVQSKKSVKKHTIWDGMRETVFAVSPIADADIVRCAQKAGITFALIMDMKNVGIDNMDIIPLELMPNL